MSYEAYIRVTCTTCPEVFEGWVPAEVKSDGRFIRLRKAVPKGWGLRSFEGSGQPEPSCPTCEECFKS